MEEAVDGLHILLVKTSRIRGRYRNGSWPSSTAPFTRVGMKRFQSHLKHDGRSAAKTDDGTVSNVPSPRQPPFLVTMILCLSFAAFFRTNTTFQRYGMLLHGINHCEPYVLLSSCSYAYQSPTGFLAQVHTQYAAIENGQPAVARAMCMSFMVRYHCKKNTVVCALEIKVEGCLLSSLGILGIERHNPACKICRYSFPNIAPPFRLGG